jgi:hypothetical protein
VIDRSMAHHLLLRPFEDPLMTDAHFWRRLLFSTLAVLTMGLFVDCDDGADELPEGWAGARRLTLRQSACAGDPYTSMPHSRLELSESDGTLAGVYKEAQFRCGNQQVCGFTLEAGPATRLLVQPCDLHPSTVPRCDCLYEVSFTLPDRSGRTSVELFSRRDLYGQQGAVPATLVDTESVP